MTVNSGTRLGPYEIEAPIGAGGMGEVYRAKDTRLDRTVAVKVLPSELSSKPGLRQRFEREARAVASLNHPHICALHDVGHQDGVDFLVMEYLEGETLAERLTHGALKTELVLRYAIQIADALENAHRQGFVHRDLKPGNIMLTRTGVKLLDFGLAKFAADERVLQAGVNLGEASTQTMQPLTAEGTIAGTLQYMAPEQLEGKETDARTDIFAFGTVVYEMATGKKAFEGKSQASLIAAILAAEPKPMLSLQPLAPPALERVVQTCLAKDPEERWQNAHDIMRELEWIAEARIAPEETKRRRLGRERVAWVLTTAALALALLASLPFTIAYLRQVPVETRPMRFSILPPEKASLGSFAVSPDGRWLAFTAATGGKDQLWVRALDGLTAQALPGTEGASYPFWSPDSRSIAFFANVKLKKIEVTGGPVQTVCDVTGGRSGGTWTRDGVIVFATSGFGLLQASATGGSAKLITVLTPQEQYISPFFLPDGYHFLEYIRSPRKETRGIYVASLDGTVKQRLLAIDSNAVYAPSLSGDRLLGYLLFLREGALLAQPFDTRQMKLTGEPLPIAEQVGRDAGYWNEFRGNFSVSDNGLLVYDSSVNRQSKQLVWVDRQGKLIRSLGAVGGYSQPCLSPDEKRVVVDRFDDQTGLYDLWTYDVGGGGASQFTFDPGPDIYPVWSSDGRRIIWRSNREGHNNFYWKAANGTGEEELLRRFSNNYPRSPTSCSLDGRFFIYYEIDPKTKRDIWVLPLSGDRKPFPFLQTEASEAAGQLSPDGQWMAYTSDESSSFEIYVRSFPSGGSQRLVSTKGGIGPLWRRDGKELFYYAPDGKLMAVEVKSGPGGGRQEASFEAGPPHALFEFRSGSVVPLPSLHSHRRWAAVSTQHDCRRVRRCAAHGGGQLAGGAEAMTLTAGTKLGPYEIEAPWRRRALTAHQCRLDASSRLSPDNSGGETMFPSFKASFLVPVRNAANTLALFLAIPLASSVALAESPIPTQTPDDLARGRQLFQGQCARCHGMDGAGGTGPGLNRSVLGRAPDDQALFSVIKEGIPGTEMPRAWQMIDGEIWQVAGYVRSLGRTARVSLPGNLEHGQQLYETKGRCSTCHIVRGRGGSLGPDLTEIGARRGVSHLRSALLNPGSNKARDSSGYISFLVMRVVTQDGREVRGIRINEDTFTLQLRDADNRAHSFRKDELKELSRESSGSLMPSYQSVFSPTEIDDLIAYLASLRGER